MVEAFSPFTFKVIICTYVFIGLSCWLSDKESACQCRRHGYDPWIRKIPWRRKWQSTPVFLPGTSHGQRSLAGYNPWGHKESLMTERLTLLVLDLRLPVGLVARIWCFLHHGPGLIPGQGKPSFFQCLHSQVCSSSCSDQACIGLPWWLRW